MTNRGTCTKCGRVMQVRADGLIRTHRDLADNRCLGGGQPPAGTKVCSGCAACDRSEGAMMRVLALADELGRANPRVFSSDWAAGHAAGRLAASEALYAALNGSADEKVTA